MNLRLIKFLFIAAAVFFGLTLSNSNASAQDMPMNMPMPSSKPKAKAKQTSKPKAKAKAKQSSKAKPKARVKPKAKPSSKTMPKNMPMNMDMPMPKPSSTPMNMPSSAPTAKPSSSPMPMDMPMNMPNMAMPTLTPKPTGNPSPTPMPMDMQMDMPTPSPSPAATPAPMPMNMPMPASSPLPATSPVQTTSSDSDGQRQTLPNLRKNFPSPVNDSANYLFVLADILEFRPSRGGDSDFRWDIQGWYGGDYNRFWFKSEGERNTSFKADYDIDLQFLYGRFIKRYYDFQAGIRFETQKFRGRNVTRPQAVIGLQGLVPYNFELESAVFIDPKGNVSGRFTFTKEVLLKNRLILQPRFETNAAIQKVERFTTGRGLNNIELGFRLPYEFRRKFAPYIGVSFDKSFFETARLVRQDGGNSGQVRFAAGVRMFY